MKASFLTIKFIPKILSLVYQFFLGKYIERKYIMPMYIQADAEYKSRNSVGQHWIRTSQDLEISIQMSTRFCENPSKIAIRNNSETIFEKVVLLVEAEGYFDGCLKNEYYTAEKRLVFTNVCTSPRIKDLTDIPPIDFWILDNGNVIFSYQNLYISIVAIKKKGQSETIQHKQKILSCCQSNYLDDLLKDNWQEKAGRYYNIGYINRAKLDLKTKIWSDFNPPPRFVTSQEYSKINIFLRKYWKLSKLLNDIRCYLLLQDKLISARFWILVMLGRNSEDENGYLKFEKYYLF
jgi:hypothetical protein